VGLRVDVAVEGRDVDEVARQSYLNRTRVALDDLSAESNFLALLRADRLGVSGRRVRDGALGALEAGLAALLREVVGVLAVDRRAAALVQIHNGCVVLDRESVQGPAQDRALRELVEAHRLRQTRRQRVVVVRAGPKQNVSRARVKRALDPFGR
jgi:hypothetical protein